MKYLVVLLVVAAVLWLLLGRRRDRPAKRAAAAAPPKPQEMLECAHCGLHLPASDAVLDGSRVYCSDTHRRLGPRRSDAE